MNAAGFFAVGIGAVLGAWSRWGLSVTLNHLLPALPLGTLTVNLVGGFLIGVTESMGGLFLGEQLGQIGISLIFILILLLRPSGLFGAKT